MTAKLSLPIMLGFVLWEIRYRSRKFVAWSLCRILIVYLAVMVFHGYWIVYQISIDYFPRSRIICSNNVIDFEMARDGMVQ